MSDNTATTLTFILFVLAGVGVYQILSWLGLPLVGIGVGALVPGFAIGVVSRDRWLT